ncbi:hypothetical protein HX001_15080 [Empedobacter brevis]|uniref:Uncharacterized protein n=1 Tax=Empedobacter brevis TaxID=247 RepID=A0AAJ1QH21_9FLAO|nr:hypothetical protein [Empedobacter brevis]MDM1073811.1 hypothetical protein [Empedobacter brevis]
MTKSKDVLTSGQKKDIEALELKLKYGDYESLASILGCSRDAARKRFKRGNDKAIKVMEQIIIARENLLKNVSH